MTRNERFMVRTVFLGSAASLLLILNGEAFARPASQNFTPGQTYDSLSTNASYLGLKAVHSAVDRSSFAKDPQRLAQFKIIEPPSASSPDTIRLRPPPSDPADSPRRRRALDDSPSGQSASQQDSDSAQPALRRRHLSERSERRKWREKRRRHHYAAPEPAPAPEPASSPTIAAPTIAAPTIAASSAASPAIAGAATDTPTTAQVLIPALKKTTATATTTAAAPVIAAPAPIPSLAKITATAAVVAPMLSGPRPATTATAPNNAAGSEAMGSSEKSPSEPVVIKEIIREYVPVVVVLPSAIWTLQDFAAQSQIPLPPFVMEAFRRQLGGSATVTPSAINGTQEHWPSVSQGVGSTTEMTRQAQDAKDANRASALDPIEPKKIEPLPRDGRP